MAAVSFLMICCEQGSGAIITAIYDLDPASVVTHIAQALDFPGYE